MSAALPADHPWTGPDSTDRGVAARPPQASVGQVAGPVFTLEQARAIQWPSPELCPIVQKGRKQFYRTPEGDCERVTSLLKCLGLGAEGLIAWSGRVEREAVLAAAGEVFAAGTHEDGPAGFLEAVEARLGVARQHQKELEKAGEIGTAIHELIRSQLSHEILGVGMPKFAAPDTVTWGWMAFQDWWKASGLVPLRSEQPVWDAGRGVAGTMDLVVWCPERGVGLIDFKTSKAVYDSHHIQVAEYVRLGRRWAPIEWASLIRLPKVVTDPAFEVVPLGQLWDRTATLEDLQSLFDCARAVHRVLKAKP